MSGTVRLGPIAIGVLIALSVGVGGLVVALSPSAPLELRLVLDGHWAHKELIVTVDPKNTGSARVVARYPENPAIDRKNQVALDRAAIEQLRRLVRQAELF